MHPPTPQQPKKSSTLATVALIFSILCAPIGLILGVIALIQISNSRGELGGKTMAIVAIVLPVAMIPIIGILAAIAIPNFIRFQLRAKQSEAKIILRSLSTSEEATFADSEKYVRLTMNPSTPPSALPAAWEDRECAEEPCLSFSAPGPVFYRYACETTGGGEGAKGEFVCVAVSDLDGDGELGAMITGTANGGGANLRGKVPQIAAALCSGTYPAGEVSDCTPGQF